MPYLGLEKRKYPRIERAFLVYYTPLSGPKEFDLTQAKNISLGGLLITTSRPLEKGLALSLKIRLPGNYYANPTARVIESYRVKPDAQFYNTRLQFSSMNDEERNAMSQTIESFSK